MNEADRLRHARSLGCRDGPGNTPTIESALREAGLERTESTPARPSPSLNRRSRDPQTGRYLPEPYDPAVQAAPDEGLSQTEIYAHVRRDWSQLPSGAKKSYARELGLPVATVRGIARGRAGLKTRILRTAVPGRSPIIEGGLPEAVRRRLSRVLHQIERKERVLVKTAQVWPNGMPRYVFQRRLISS